ncbi:MAG: hypothetical protein ACRESZ_01890 [Methylococcales bacterium]
MTMIIQWQVVATIAAPLIALFVGIWANRRVESRPALISYFGHVSSFRYTPPGGQLVIIHTHAVILRNTGRRSATNVRLSHRILPDFNIWPAVMHHIEDVPSGGRDIVIPTLVPGEQVTLSYLYFPPHTVADVNAGIKHDGGFAQQIPVLLQRQYSRWFNITEGLLMLLGTTSAIYVLYQLASWAYGKLPA